MLTSEHKISRVEKWLFIEWHFVYQTKVGLIFNFI